MQSALITFHTRVDTVACRPRFGTRGNAGCAHVAKEFLLYSFVTIVAKA